MLLAMFLQVSMHASGKYLLQTYSFRYKPSGLTSFIWSGGAGSLPTRKKPRQNQQTAVTDLRGISLLMVTGFYFLSLRRMKIAEANAALYMTSPFMVMLLSDVFSEEEDRIASVGQHRARRSRHADHP